MYENWLSPTQPGTEIKVTPEREAPIIPNATTNQGDFRLARKKEALLAFFPVNQEMTNKIEK
jgi:hypothetical protein